MPIPEDAKTPAQLSWRHMFNKCVDLWHTLSAAEQQEWERLARPKHMTGYAWYISQCLRPNPGIYLPLQGGTMSGDIDMAKHRILKLPAPTDPQEAARLADVGVGSFLGLTDTPASYAGQALKHVRVNAAQNALQFVRNTFLALLDTPASYAGQALKFVRVNAATNALEFTTAVGGYTEGTRVYNNADISIPNDTVTVLTFNSERYDTDSIHSTVANTSRLTCQTAGKYIICANTRFAASATGRRMFQFMLNGSIIITEVQLPATAADHMGFSLSTIYDLSVGDYVEHTAFQNSGGALDVKCSANFSPEFMMQRIG